MSTPYAMPNMLALLYHQHRQYTVELNRNYHTLSKLYKKLAKAERMLVERQERRLSRNDRKKWQYTRALSRRTVANLESQRGILHDALRQCRDLIACGELSAHGSKIRLWASQLPPSPYLFTPYSPVMLTPWVTSFPRYGAENQHENEPRYWDLSMLRERRYSSPYRSPADSENYESAIHSITSHAMQPDTVNHNYTPKMISRELSNPLVDSFLPMRSCTDYEKDQVPTLPALSVSTAQHGDHSSTSQHKRGHSADVITSNICYVKTASEKRGASAGRPPGMRKDAEYVLLGAVRKQTQLVAAEATDNS